MRPIPAPQKLDVCQLIRSHLALFSDVPTRTSVLQHGIDVGDSTPIKQHPYHVNPFKKELLRKEVEYLLANGLAVPSSSLWSSPCLLVPKALLDSVQGGKWCYQG